MTDVLNATSRRRIILKKFSTCVFMRGAGRILDVCPNTQVRLSHIRPYPTDRIALQQDWVRIGQEFWNVIHREIGLKRYGASVLPYSRLKFTKANTRTHDDR